MKNDSKDSVLHRPAQQRISAFVPAGWTPHDGSGCPVDYASSPAVIFRDGHRVDGGVLRADTWKPNWTWQPQSRNRDDVIAYRVD